MPGCTRSTNTIHIKLTQITLDLWVFIIILLV